MKPKAWYGISQKEYEGPEPCFFDSSEFPWVKEFEAQYPVMMEELAPLMNEENHLLIPYFDTAIQFPPQNWRTIGFFFWGKQNLANCIRFPKTTAILKNIPDLIGTSLNLLEPGSRIKPHFGDTNAVIRSHYGLIVPGTLPECGFRVRNELRPWEEGKLMMFMDAYEHEAFNMTKGKRFILLLDIIRPEFREKKRTICSRVLGMVSMYYVAEQLGFDLKKLPQRVLYIILAPFQVIWWLYMPFQPIINRLKYKLGSR